LVQDRSLGQTQDARRTIHRARELPGEVIAIRDHFRLRLRVPGLGDPLHEPGTDARTPRPDPDAAVLSVFAYRYCRDGAPGHVAVLDAAAASVSITLVDNLAQAQVHAALNDAWGYTPLPPVREGSIRWLEEDTAIGIELHASSFDVRAAIERLGAPTFIAGNHPRDAEVSYFASMREARTGWLEINGTRLSGEPFLHRGYEPWIGRPKFSASVQIGETLVTRLPLRHPDSLSS
jgi:hypothetical protein